MFILLQMSFLERQIWRLKTIIDMISTLGIKNISSAETLLNEYLGKTTKITTVWF